MKNIKFAFFSVLIIMAFFASCKKEKPALIQPCELSKPVKASFEMGYKILIDSCDNISKNDYYKLEVNDTVYGGFITFKSTVNCYDSLRWIIGFDPTVYTQKEFSLFFNTSTIGQTIPITLIAKLKPNEVCNPSDDGIDTLTRLLYIKQYDDSLGNTGDFMGYNIDDQSDVFIVSFIPENENNGNETIHNLPKGANPPFGVGRVKMSGFYRGLYFCREFDNGTHGFDNIIGVARFSSDYNQITIDYSYSINPLIPNSSSNSITKRFVGTRV